MKFNDSVSLINVPELFTGEPQTWADLGCGEGTFTYALDSLIPTGSSIYAVDTRPGQFEPITAKGNQITALRKNFVFDELNLPPLDGIIMANSLHYVQDKQAFYPKLASMLKPGGVMLLVEYDTDEPNRWVPFPISWSKLKHRFTKIGEVASMYQTAGMYGCYCKPFLAP